MQAAIERVVAVQGNMRFETARLFNVVEGRPLPILEKTGADDRVQSFLNCAISHPAFSCAIPATTNPHHQIHKIAASRGPLKDKNMRAGMVKHMESIPGFDKQAGMALYPGKQFNATIRRAQAHRAAALKT